MLLRRHTYLIKPRWRALQESESAIFEVGAAVAGLALEQAR